MNYYANQALKTFRRGGFRAFGEKLLAFWRYQTKVFLIPRVISQIRHLRPDARLEELIDFAFNSNKSLLKPQQIISEITELIKTLKGNPPKYPLEIGTAEGGTLFLLSRAAASDATIISLDLPGGGFDKGSYPLWKIPLYKSFTSQNQQLHLIRADSHQQKTLEKVKAKLKEQMLDFLFIDGDHTYKGVKEDFELYAPLVKTGGLIALHDIVPHPPEADCHVNKFWEEIKSKYESWEIVEDKEQKWGGIGVIIV